MQYLKTHYGRAIPVILSETVNIPNPANLGLSSLTTDGDSFLLIDDTVTFTTNLIGSIVVVDDSSIATVVGFVDEHALELSDDIATSPGLPYKIYNSKPNEGCSLYIPAETTAKLKVLTAGGDIVTFEKCGDTSSSMILPVQVLRVFKNGTELNDLVALW